MHHSNISQGQSCGGHHKNKVVTWWSNETIHLFIYLSILMPYSVQYCVNIDQKITFYISENSTLRLNVQYSPFWVFFGCDFLCCFSATTMSLYLSGTPKYDSSKPTRWWGNCSVSKNVNNNKLNSVSAPLVPHNTSNAIRHYHVQ